MKRNETKETKVQNISRRKMWSAEGGFRALPHYPKATMACRRDQHQWSGWHSGWWQYIHQSRFFPYRGQEANRPRRHLSMLGWHVDKGFEIVLDSQKCTGKSIWCIPELNIWDWAHKHLESKQQKSKQELYRRPWISSPGVWQGTGFSPMCLAHTDMLCGFAGKLLVLCCCSFFMLLHREVAMKSKLEDSHEATTPMINTYGKRPFPSLKENYNYPAKS